jgi:hypothetical protein
METLMTLSWMNIYGVLSANSADLHMHYSIVLVKNQNQNSDFSSIFICLSQRGIGQYKQTILRTTTGFFRSIGFIQTKISEIRTRH